ncbi:dienelactone hydrolase family protein [Roseinatronobacter alkalisoli]|uniref:Dienelactone hydrolase family protein n=1 Tax=Roseinatronobacter alkalisoli TaxID=3028235 RepID=A0ABT5T3W2_9RHOB|nr:dienelactone hydrolase family protein [Roseinatronobacter sp. HJB301]MDD7969666.1 dienelactone hydrolase family protein [Roseinatronobacter sp. HJB301]
MFKPLTADDGHRFECWMQPAEGSPQGGLVILQEIFGVTEQLRGVARDYAAKGFNIAIPALFDRQQRGAIIPFDNAAPGRDMMLAAKPDDTMRDIAAAVNALAQTSNKVAVLGFCWGGGLAIRAAQVLDIACAVRFYGTRLPQYMDMALGKPVQGHFGTRDDHVPPEMLDQARAAFPTLEIHMYDCGHAFANDARPDAYDAEAATLAHARAQAFLSTHLG